MDAMRWAHGGQEERGVGEEEEEAEAGLRLQAVRLGFALIDGREGEQQVGLVSSRLSSPHLSRATIQVHVDDAKGETEDEDEALTPLYIVPILLPVHQRIIRIQTMLIKASDGKITPRATLQTTARTAVTRACTLAFCTRTASKSLQSPDVVRVLSPGREWVLEGTRGLRTCRCTPSPSAQMAPTCTNLHQPGQHSLGAVHPSSFALRAGNDTRRWTIGGPAAAYPPRFCASQPSPALHMQSTRTDPPHVWVAAGVTIRAF
ncbi:hypothetical protein K438DRAFT_1773212 [Mycena galopus ATCC 62051]|nr:hypothetical protein K438DRAFT_1773212 [Mycena galopus ATCC 62051]